MLVTPWLVRSWSGWSLIKAVDGREVRCRGSSTVTLSVEEVQLKMRLLVLEHILNSIDTDISMDAIDKLGVSLLIGTTFHSVEHSVQ